MTLRRYERCDCQGSIIQPLLPNKPRGGLHADDRTMLNGISWRIRTGSSWVDIPERFGPATTLNGVPHGLLRSKPVILNGVYTSREQH